MCSALTIQLNGESRSFSDLKHPANMIELLDALALKQDRIAVEQNGAIVPRSAWPQTQVHEGDRLEIVHFVGGGR